ncbi:hypothetical protein CapIbe_011426 [Capra ibex]
MKSCSADVTGCGSTCVVPGGEPLLGGSLGLGLCDLTSGRTKRRMPSASEMLNGPNWWFAGSVIAPALGRACVPGFPIFAVPRAA